ncbi:hypothetical protein HK103_002276, partial [Boothiomyces macroporosus]
MAKRNHRHSEEEPLLPTTNGGTITSNSPVQKKEQQRLPKRTTKTSQKLTLFPEGLTDPTDFDPALEDESQLPHVTAKTQKEQWYLIYTPFTFDPIIELDAQQAIIPDLISVSASHEHSHPASIQETDNFFDQNIDASGKSIPGDVSYGDLAKRIAPIGEVLIFDYGVVVLWGFTEEEEIRILEDISQFQEDVIEKDSVETEQFYFHYNSFYQPRIYNDIITLKNPANFMLKITISHAIAQSVKLTLFEGLIEETIESTKHIPRKMAKDGKIHMSRMAINQKIGQLFIMRINVNLVSNVLDTPEIFWSEPALEPLYRAIRGYLEISQRVELLNQRVGVISDLLDMLKEHLNSSHGEQLEWIVIILI